MNNPRTVYRKEVSRKGKVSYVPCGCEIDTLDDGIWYVRTKPAHRSTTSVEYITSLMSIGQSVKPVPEICGAYDIATDIMDSAEYREMVGGQFSLHDLVTKVVSLTLDRLSEGKGGE